MDYEKQDTTTFNMSLATLERIDNLLKRISEYRIIGNAIILQRVTFQLYKEVYPFLNKQERLDCENYKINIRDRLQRDMKIRGKEFHFQFLDSFELYLRDKLLEKGLLMAKSDSPHVAIGE